MASIGCSRTRSYAKAVAVLALAAAALAATDACRTPTEITIVLTTDARCPASTEAGDRFVGAGIVAGPKNVLNKLSALGETKSCTDRKGANDIGTLVIFPNDANDATVEVLIAAGVTNVRGETLSADECLAKVQGHALMAGDPCSIRRRVQRRIG